MRMTAVRKGGGEHKQEKEYLRQDTREVLGGIEEGQKNCVRGKQFLYPIARREILKGSFTRGGKCIEQKKIRVGQAGRRAP